MSANDLTPFTIDHDDVHTSSGTGSTVVSPVAIEELASAPDDHPVQTQIQTQTESEADAKLEPDQVLVHDQVPQNCTPELEAIKENTEEEDQEQVSVDDQVAVDSQKLTQDQDEIKEQVQQEQDNEPPKNIEDIEEEDDEDDDYDPEMSFTSSAVSKPSSVTTPLSAPIISKPNHNFKLNDPRLTKSEGVSEELHEQTNNSKNISTSNDSNEVNHTDSNKSYEDHNRSFAMTTDDTNDGNKQANVNTPYQPASTIVPSTIPSNIDLQKVLASMTTHSDSKTDESNVNKAIPSPAASNSLPTSSAESSFGAGFDAGKASIPTPSEMNALLAKYGPPLRDFNAIKSFYTPEQEAIFEKFLEDEAEYLASGDWDRFPLGTRLFIGNLPTHPPINRRMIFKIFSKYGRICQISIKSTYAFIQFFEIMDCHAAIKMEGSDPLFDEKLLLEISKPQSGRKHGPGLGQPQGFTSGKSHDAGARGGRRPRSRSPPYRRDGRGGGSSGRGGHRGRSPPPYRSNNGPGYRERSPSGRSNGGGRFGGQDSYDSPLPYRPGHEVPECQIFLLDNRLDDQYIWSVERALKDAHFIFNTKLLPPRVPLKAAIQQMVREGVLGVIMLNYRLQRDNKVNVQVFDRSAAHAGGADSTGVRFDEYLGVDTPVAVELLTRARRQDHQSRPNHHNRGYDRQTYGGNQSYSYGHGQADRDNHYGSRQITNDSYSNQYSPSTQYSGYNNRGSPSIPGPALANTNSLASNLLGTLQNMDPATLQKVAMALQQQQQSPVIQQQQQKQTPMYESNPAPNYNPNSGQSPYGGRPGVAPVPNTPYYGGAGSIQLPGMPSQSAPGLPQQPQAGGTHQVHNIMEQLAKLQGQMRPN